MRNKIFYLLISRKRILGLFFIIMIVLCGCATETSPNHMDVENTTVLKEDMSNVVSEEANSVTTDEAKTTKPATSINNDDFWGVFTPDTSEDNDYVKEIKKSREWNTGTQTQVYAADYDGNDMVEAFVFCGEYTDSEFIGDLWFVDERMKAICLEEDMYAFMEQVYYKDAGRLYLLFSHNIGNPVRTEMYTVKFGQAVNVSENLPGQKWVDENGLIIVVAEAYDAFFDREDGEAEGIWTGHTWKFYPFYFEGGKLTEVDACEIDLETVDKMAPLPEAIIEYLADTEERKVAATQLFYREKTKEMIINIAYDYGDGNNQSYGFENILYRLAETGQWEYVEANTGIYSRQYSQESFWEFTDGL